MSKAPTSTADTVSSKLITSRIHLDEAMAQLQALHNQRDAEQAKLDKKIATATAKHQDALNGFDADIHLYQTAIEEYALEESDSLLHGLKTKTVKLAAGQLKYSKGRRSVSLILDEDDVIKQLRAIGRADLVVVSERIDKSTIGKLDAPPVDGISFVEPTLTVKVVTN